MLFHEANDGSDFYGFTNLVDLSCPTVLTLARHAQDWFLQGTPEQKRTIVDCVGSNLVLRDKKLHVQMQKPFQAILEGSLALRANPPPLEPAGGDFHPDEFRPTHPSFRAYCGQRGSNSRLLL